MKPDLVMNTFLLEAFRRFRAPCPPTGLYASDEGRMLAEMGDTTFKLGDLAHDSYQDVMLGDALLDPLEQSFSQSAPQCSTCAYESFCGADPVFHHTTQDTLDKLSPKSLQIAGDVVLATVKLLDAR